MVTTVTVDDDAKSRLEELQTEIRLRTGRKISEQELLTRLVSEAHESPNDFVDSFHESSTPLSDAEKETVCEAQFNSGVETDEDDIDDILY